MIENIKQRKIIRELMRKKGQKYSELLKLFPDLDKIAYHLNHLVKKNCIIKENDGYYLTLKGANEIANFKWETLEDVHGHTSMYFGLVCKYKNKYFLRQVTTNPFKNWYKLPGDLSGDEGRNGIYQRVNTYLNIKLNPTQLNFHSTHHRIVLMPNGQFSWDSYLIVFKIHITDMQYIKLNKTRSDAKWFTKDEIKKIKNKWPELDFCISNKIQKHFHEYYISENSKYNKILI